MAWTNLNFAFGSLLTSAKMTQLDANLDAIAVGDEGAPAVKNNTGIFIVSSSDVSTFSATGGSWFDYLPFNLYIPSAVNTMVLLHRHSGTTSATNNSRIVSSGSWVVSDATANAYWFNGYPATSYETAYMDVSSIRGTDQLLTLQLNSLTNIMFLSSFIYFE